MANDDTGPLLTLIGEILSADTRYPVENTMLYAEVELGTVSQSVFKDDGHNAVYRWVSSPRLTQALLDLWEAEVPEKRWVQMEYIIRGGQFRAHFTYSEEIEKEEDQFDRRDRIVKRHFGNKPIVYPSWPPPGPEAREFEP